MTKDEIIEVMTKAIPTSHTHPALTRAEMQCAHDAIIAAGLIIVPVEPTEAMLDAGETSLRGSTVRGSKIEKAYRAMIGEVK